MSARRIEVYHSTDHGDGAAYCWRDLRECGDGDVCESETLAGALAEVSAWSGVAVGDLIVSASASRQGTREHEAGDALNRRIAEVAASCAATLREQGWVGGGRDYTTGAYPGDEAALADALGRAPELAEIGALEVHIREALDEAVAS